ncbi:hypothetical protein NLM32_09165 [Bradyrhizobium sp. CCGUVB14]|nr:hypothetical protein [Bradyrhizobium sp. CCGUVB14]MCP3441227.1 hypothetical protein [Bradyrhizobium sp. CCGUVB14]
MRRGFPSLALQVQEVLRKAPLSGHLFVSRFFGTIGWACRSNLGAPTAGSSSAHGVARRGIDRSGADGLYARGHRLTESATELATAKRGQNEKICG